MTRLQVLAQYPSQELREIVDRLNRLLGLKPGAIRPGTTKKFKGTTYECVRNAADIIVLRYYGSAVSLTSEIAMMVELAGFRKPSVVRSGVVTFSAIMPTR